MKKIVFCAFIILFACIANAQEAEFQNKIFVGGTASLLIQNNAFPISSIGTISGIGSIFSSNINESKNTSFYIIPYIGKELNPKLSLGIFLDYCFGKYVGQNQFFFGEPMLEDFERITNQYGIGIFSRHIINPNNKLKFFIQPSAQYSFISQLESRTQINDQVILHEEEVNFISIGLSPGILYDINQKLRVRLRSSGINYVNGNYKVIDSDTSQNFSSFNSTLSLSSIGFGIELTF